MKINPSRKEIEHAANLMVNKFNISMQLLAQLFGVDARDQANTVLRQLGSKTLDREELAKLLILRRGSMLLGGSQEDIKKLRRQLLTTLTEEEIKRLFEKHIHKDTAIKSPSYMITPLVEKRWQPNGKWPLDFVDSLGLPRIFAGVRQSQSAPTFENIQPLTPVPKLVEFQQNLKEKMLEVLNRDGDRTRCIVTLPTGGGKTRVAVEAFIDWMQPRFSEGKYMLWIAQSEELCEQVISCVQQMWSSREFVSSLRVYRYFRGRDINNTEDLCGGVVVSSIHQLHSRIKSGDQALEMILKDTGAIIIDEAHRAVSEMYDNLLNKALELCGPNLFPICGLSATPGRSGFNKKDDTQKLVKRFEAYVIQPDLGIEYNEDPLRYFREKQYLARANHITYQSGKEYILTDQELSQISSDGEYIGPTFLKRLAADNDRNLLIINKLLQLPKGKPVLVYACTVEHAHFLSVILTANGRPSGTISSDTPLTIRRGLIQDFKEGKIDFLCNYGVLTTGFDAPKTEYVVICRPMTSIILYEQIIGRGLRGPKFGGTEECCIIDFADNIHKLGPSLAYARFSDFWNSKKEE